MTGPRRILLAQTSFLGDVVLTTPLARVLADALPGAEISWLVRPEAAALLAPAFGADRVLVLDKRGADRGLGGLRARSRQLRSLGFDAAIGVQRSLRTAALLALARIPLRVGFRGTLGAPLYHRTIEHAGAHARDRLLGLARGLDVAVPAPAPDPELVVDPGAAAAVAARLAAASIGSAERLLVLAPGAAWATKRWPPAHFAGAAARLLAADADAVITVGAAGDRLAAGEVVRGLARARVVDWSGTTSTAELAALLARAHLLIANDSAPAHVAAALGRPVVAIFGPTVPAQGFAPLGPRVRVVGRDLGCRPCSRHGGARCPIGTHECMVDLGVEAVVAAARALLGGAAEPARGAATRSAGMSRP